MQTPTNTVVLWLTRLFHAVFVVFVIGSSLWLSLAIWIQQPLGLLFSSVLIVLWIALSCVVLGIYFSRHLISRPLDILIYILIFALSLVWYFNIEARQDRVWNAEVAEMLHYEQQGDLVTLHNVRNFDWHHDGSYTERWETRQFDLNQITGVNVITSYWMGPKIAHTLISFDFADQKPLTFSIEIRKEKDEDFSAIGGFFRKFELSLIASDEKDIVYTRSNIRGEQVYFFPVNMQKNEAKALFNAYLKKADDLRAEPKWYNTLTSNCTTLVFDMVQAVSNKPIPTDYRLIVSGYLPNYLYDLHAIHHEWDIATWYQKAHVNPKVPFGSNISSQQYSELMRKNLKP
ncbi:hypothetical protein A3K93_01555 [Acinetobacter sp. NCu2D-2]|uniref:Lnb N-terminal periplasmic domain-containing protein n=1 Tax=Acinetobacter sp. NCu2D-2 TaxID=1608473 RepID=UPI0007CDC2A4|nr:DUF4105 domain-containing protein [Acinetobacter sp. NCu2D-2]ANF81003.1 hypothetical protein A3K93_01555 [Acinetobacter sp. NCu2D-2]